MTNITRFTKEQLIEQAQNNLIGLKNYVTVYPERADSEAMNIRLAEIALASLEAEPVACPKCNDTGMADSGGVQPWGEPISVPCDCTATPAPVADSEPVAWTSEEALAEVCCDETGMIGPQYMVGNIPLYLHAQHAPVVPDEVNLAIENLKQKLVECNRYNYCSDAVKRIEDSCRAAMLQGAEPVSKREKVRRDHAEWSDVTFGNVGPVGPLKHLSKEALEAAAEPGDLSEWADMQFLLWDAQRRAGISDGEITAAMEEKLAINKTRQWPEPKDGEPRLHIKEQSESVLPEIECDICGHVSTDPEGRHHCCEDNSND